MSMNNVPNEEMNNAAMEQQAAVEDAAVAEQAADAAVANQDAATMNEEAAAEQDAQVIEAVAQGLEDEEITATDIMTAVLSESLGISPAGAQSLFNLLMSELVDDTVEAEEAIDDTPME